MRKIAKLIVVVVVGAVIGAGLYFLFGGHGLPCMFVSIFIVALAGVAMFAPCIK